MSVMKEVIFVSKCVITLLGAIFVNVILDMNLILMPSTAQVNTIKFISLQLVVNVLLIPIGSRFCIFKHL